MQSPFEYVSVLISIILGLGITQIVTGFADLIQQWERTKLYWPHLLWTVIIFFLHIQEWWNIYELRYNNVWRLPSFLFISLYPINLFILARLLFPLHHHDNSLLDYKTFYFNNYRKFFLVLIFSALLSSIENYILSNRGVQGIIAQGIIIVTLSIIAARKIEKEWIHKTVVILWIGGVLISMLVYWNDWLIT